MASKALAKDERQDVLKSWFGEYSLLGTRLDRNPDWQAQWQIGMDELFSRIPLENLMSYLDFEAVVRRLPKEIGDRPEIFAPIAVPGISNVTVGAEPSHVLITKIAYVKKGRAVPPHGHSNMVSAFLNLSGEFHIRLFDRLKMDQQTMLVRKTEDRVCGKGDWSSVSDYRNNVHWIEAQSEDCFLFTSKMIRLVPDTAYRDRIFVDVLEARELGNQVLAAPMITRKQARERY